MQLIQSLDTSGARAAESFVHQGRRLLVIPQLAEDVAGQPPLMTVGNSDVSAQVFLWRDGLFEPLMSLPVPGGEDAEHFRIGDREFLATATLRTGAGPYDLNAHSTIFEIRDGRFEAFQQIPTFAAKQWRHFRIGERDFLALAQGASLEGHQPRHPSASMMYEWDGAMFQEFQRVQSAWGYNWEFFELAGSTFLAYADHVEGSRILRWDGKRFEPFQELEGKSGRAFSFFEHGGHAWLVFACLHDDTVLYRWDGSRFEQRQVVSGPGGRELRWIAHQQRLVLVNFLHGSREAPQPSLLSAVYRFEAGRLVVDEEFPTLGGTDAAVFQDGAKTYMVVANSLSAEVRFRTQSRVYLLDGKAATSQS